MRLVFMTLVALLLMTAPTYAQNPCVDGLPGFVSNPAKLYVPVAEYNILEVDGNPRISEFSYALFAEGTPTTGTPVQGPSTVPRSSFTLAPGTTDCYAASLPASIPTGQRLVAALKAKRVASSTVDAAESPWSVVSNPFGSAPTALAALGAPVVRQ